jgi:hypothetical protein
VVLGYKGALGGSLIVYILPAAMYYALLEERRRRKQRLSVGDGGERRGRTDDEAGVDEDGGRGVREDAPLRPTHSTAVVPDERLPAGAAAAVRCGPFAWASPHGALLLVMTALGLTIMVLGTATTAGLIKVPSRR